MTGKRTKRSGSASRRRARFRKNNDQTQTSQQTPEQGQQTSDDQKQRLQWTLEQTQLRYKELQDKHDKLMDLAARLLGFCAISGFTTYLSNSTWQDLTGPAKSNLRRSVILLLIAVIVAVIVLSVFMAMSSFRDWKITDIATLEQEQSTEEKTISLIKTLSDRIEVLRGLNFLITITVFIMYGIYACSLELLVLIIILYH